MMDLVYILGKGSRWKNNEIRFSLRSVEKNLKHRKVFVIGYKPDWMTGVIHVPMNDPYQHKQKNAIEKIRLACKNSEISEAFILMNDDFFLLQNCGESFPGFTYKTITDLMDNHSTKGGYYYRAMKDTIGLLREANIGDVNFEIHAPIVFEKTKFLQMTDAINWMETGYLFRSIYGNSFGIKTEELEQDCKAYDWYGVPIIARRSPILSIADAVALHPKFQKFIQERFPEKSHFENARPVL